MVVADESAAARAAHDVWETTQMRIALSVTWAALLVAAIMAIGGRFIGSSELQLASIVFLYGVANLVTGFYFGRTRSGDQQRIADV